MSLGGGTPDCPRGLCGWESYLFTSEKRNLTMKAVWEPREQKQEEAILRGGSSIGFLSLP